MNTTEIKILLDKYFDGETSLNEERILKNYFASDHADDTLKKHAHMFAFFKTESKVEPAGTLEDKIFDSLDTFTNSPFYKRKTFWIYFSGIAASVLFVLTLIIETKYHTTLKNSVAETSFTRQDALLAYNRTKIALGYVSEKYTTATDPLSEVDKFSNSTIAITHLEKIEDELNKINSNVNKMSRGVDNLQKLSKFSIIVKP